MFSLLIYWLICLLIPLSCCSAAYLLFSWFKLDAKPENLMLTLSASLLFFAALFVIKVAGVPLIIVRGLGYLVIIGGFYSFIKGKLWTNINFPLLYIFSAILFVKFAFVLFWHHPAQGADWIKTIYVKPYLLDYFGISTTVKNELYPYYLIDRTPLFFLITAGLHQMFNGSLSNLWVSQIASLWLNSLLLLAAYYIVRHYWSEKTARWLLVFSCFNPFLFYQTIYSSPKNFVVFYILASFYFFFISKVSFRIWWGGLLLGLAYVAHYYALFYIFTVFVVLGYDRRWTHLMKAFVIVSGIVMIYYFGIYKCFGEIHLKQFSTPLASERSIESEVLSRNYKSNIAKTFELFSNLTFKEVGKIRLNNFLTTFLPFRSHRFFRWFFQFPYALGFAGYLLSLFGLFVLTWRERKFFPLSLLALLPPVLLILTWGYEHYGMVGQGLHPSVVILLMFTAATLGLVKGKYQVLAGVVLLTEQIAFLSWFAYFWFTNLMYREDTIKVWEHRGLPGFNYSDIVLPYQLGSLTLRITSTAVMGILFVIVGYYCLKLTRDDVFGN